MSTNERIASAELIKAINNIFGGKGKKGITGVDKILELAKTNPFITLAELQKIVASRPVFSLTRSKATKNFYALIKKGTFPIKELAHIKCNDIFRERFKFHHETDKSDINIKTQYYRDNIKYNQLPLSKHELQLLAELGQIDKACIQQTTLKRHYPTNNSPAFVIKKSIQNISLVEWAFKAKDYHSLQCLLELDANIHRRNAKHKTVYETALERLDNKALNIIFRSRQAVRNIEIFKPLITKAIENESKQALHLLLNLIVCGDFKLIFHSCKLNLFERILAKYKWNSQKEKVTGTLYLLDKNNHGFIKPSSEESKQLLKKIHESKGKVKPINKGARGEIYVFKDNLPVNEPPLSQLCSYNK